MKSLFCKAVSLLLFVFLSYVYAVHAVLIYNVSTPVNGWGQLGITDYEGADYGGSTLGRITDSIPVLFGNLQSTVHFDPIANTLRQTGSIPLIVNNNPIIFNELQRINDQMVSGVLTINQAFNNNLYEFDTGTLPLIFDSANKAHLGNPLGGPSDVGFFNALPRVNASWSLLTDGQTYTGDFS